MLKSHSIPMGLEEYERIPYQPGWKHEYWDGRLRLSPNHHVTSYRKTINKAQTTTSTLETRLLLELEPTAFTSAFTASFNDTIDFVDQSSLKVRAFATTFWNQLAAGARGTIHPASQAFVSTGKKLES